MVRTACRAFYDGGSITFSRNLIARFAYFKNLNKAEAIVVNLSDRIVYDPGWNTNRTVDGNEFPYIRSEGSTSINGHAQYSPDFDEDDLPLLGAEGRAWKLVLPEDPEWISLGVSFYGYLESPYDLIPSMDYISPNFYGDADGLSGYKELNLASVYTDANKCNQWMSEFPDNSPSNPVTPKIYFGILPAGSDLSILDNKGYNTTGNHVLS